MRLKGKALGWVVAAVVLGVITIVMLATSGGDEDEADIGGPVRIEPAAPRVDEVIRPDDPARFGFEPFPVLGAPMHVVETIMKDRLKPQGDDFYTYRVATGGSQVRVALRVRDAHVSSLSAELELHAARDQAIEALKRKYADASSYEALSDRHRWMLRDGRRIEVFPRGSGGLVIRMADDGRIRP